MSQAYQMLQVPKKSVPPWKPIGASASLICVQRQLVVREGNLLRYSTEEVSPNTNTSDEARMFASQALPDPATPEVTQGGLVAALDQVLTDQSLGKITDMRIQVYDACNPRHRRAIGVPPQTLSANERLLAAFDDDQRAQYPNVSLHGPNTFACLRKERANLQTMSVLWCGRPIVWVVIPPRHSDKLECLMKKHLHLKPKCSQFIRHQQVLIPPTTLSKWGIMFNIFVQSAGEAVRTDYLAYYYRWYTGLSKFEEICCSEDDWGLPPMYKFCMRNEECGSIPGTSADASMTNVPHSRESSMERQKGEKDLVLGHGRGRYPLSTEHDSGDEKEGTVDLITADFDRSDDLEQRDPESCSAPSIESISSPFSDELADVGAPLASSIFTDQELVQVDENHSPDSDFFISTEHQSHRRLPAQGIIAQAEPSPKSVRDSLSIRSGDMNSPQSPTADGNYPLEAGPSTPSATSNVRQEGIFPTPPPSSSATQPECTSTRFAGPGVLQQINQLIDFGKKHHRRFNWLSVRQFTGEEDLAEDLARLLDSLQPANWLNDDAIMESLHHIRKGQSKTSVIDSHSFQSAYELWTSKKEVRETFFVWDTAGLVLIPAIVHSHWFLISVNTTTQSVTIHDPQRRPSIEEFLKAGLPSLSCKTVSQSNLQSDGANCGIILLREAECLLSPNLAPLRDFCELRRHYLQLLTDDMLPTTPEQSLPQESDDESGLAVNTRSPSARTEVSTVSQQSNIVRGTVPDEHLEDIAAAIGCGQVRRDLERVVALIHSLPGDVDSSIKSALDIFARGMSKEYCGALEQHYSSVRVAHRFNALVEQWQKENTEQRRKRKRGKKYSENGRGHSGRKYAYDTLVEECRRDTNDLRLRTEIAQAKRHGEPLLRYEEVSGPTHPLWLLFPLRDMHSPSNGAFVVKPIM
ncbi:hypothetical protein LTR13_008209 [Exophiala sideris]|nr:hypothetical protein LTR13_008209 [Exophiala sideris]KAK5176421.1 hypothetical protein LTR44_011043 [Eurotiomycetes sp. CCFEE 6388]